jgi:hypothetical protein
MSTISAGHVKFGMEAVSEHTYKFCIKKIFVYIKNMVTMQNSGVMTQNIQNMDFYASKNYDDS